MQPSDRPAFARFFPSNAGYSIALTAVFSAVIGVLTTLLGTLFFRDYGFALFMGVPALMGILVPLLHGLGGRRGFSGMMLANIIGQVILFFALLVLGIEGAGCPIMCAPLWSVVSLLGTAVVYPIHHVMWQGYAPRIARGFPVVGLLILAALPLWMGAEHALPHGPDARMVTTAVEINASPEIVWRHVLTFPELARPTEWIFQLGAAYPVRAHVEGQGVGAVRRCEFSTGAFVEPITAWDENHLLAFDVLSSPPSMQEVNPFWDIHPPHLQGYLLSRHGQFKLTDLGNGRTRLEGTTWYQNNMYPAAYWNLWSDNIIHHIHGRVLSHIKALAEEETAGSTESQPGNSQTSDGGR